MLFARLRKLHSREKSSGQALVELALVMPLLLGMVAVLFQFGVIFIALLSIVHETRDVGRWVAVHPDEKVDTDLQQMARDNAPNVINKNVLTLTVTPSCTAADKAANNNRCPNRNATDMVTLRMAYDIAGSLFLPNPIRLGFLQLTLPQMQPVYTYSVMVEPHT